MTVLLAPIAINLDASAFAMSVIEFPSRELGGESCACLGIDIQSFLGAPRNELVGIDYGADNGHSGTFGLALSALGSIVPGLIGSRQDVRIRHDLENARIILAVEPGNSSNSNRHNSGSVGCLDNSNEDRAPGESQGSSGGHRYKILAGQSVSAPEIRRARGPLKGGTAPSGARPISRRRGWRRSQRVATLFQIGMTAF
jgi:hypothetical protein